MASENTARPGGWNSQGLQFAQPGHDLHLHILDDKGAHEQPFDPLDTESANKDLATAKNDPVIQLIEGRNSPAIGFRTTQEFVQSRCAAWGMHSAFIQRIMRKPGALPWFTHNLDFNDSTGVVLSGISICYRWGLGHNIFMVVFGRYSVKKNVFNLFVSSKGIMPLNWSIHQLLSMHQDELRAHPLQLVGLLLEICERFIDLQTQEMNRRHLQVARRLGVSHDDWLGGWHIDPANEPDMSRFIYIAYDWTSWLIRSCRDLISIASNLLSLPTTSIQDMVLKIWGCC